MYNLRHFVSHAAFTSIMYVSKPNERLFAAPPPLPHTLTMLSLKCRNFFLSDLCYDWKRMLDKSFNLSVFQKKWSLYFSHNFYPPFFGTKGYFLPKITNIDGTQTNKKYFPKLWFFKHTPMGEVFWGKIRRIIHFTHYWCVCVCVFEVTLNNHKSFQFGAFGTARQKHLRHSTISFFGKYF